MEISRLSFSKKTQEAMNKNMGVMKKGKVLFARLQELDSDGTLSKAKTRADVARLVGYSEERANAGYAWVSSLIKRGYVSETVQGWTPNGKMIAEYHMTGSKPDYGYERVKRRRAKDKAGQELRRWQDKVAAGYIPQSPEIPETQVFDEKQVADDTKITTPIKIEITRGDMTITVEFAEVEHATNLIATILKGE